jgi:RNA polymerase sigma factor (TIGR02999 family)
MNTERGVSERRFQADISASTELDGLIRLAYDELRAVAHRHLMRQGGETLDTTELVHEAYLKLAAGSPGVWRDQAHFRAVTSVAMRHILVDRARARATVKRGGGLTRVSLDGGAIASDDDPDALLAIDAALIRMSAVAPRLARLVELRFYGGLSDNEIAEHLGLTIRTVQRDWTKARMLLESALGA